MTIFDGRRESSSLKDAAFNTVRKINRNTNQEIIDEYERLQVRNELDLPKKHDDFTTIEDFSNWISDQLVERAGDIRDHGFEHQLSEQLNIPRILLPDSVAEDAARFNMRANKKHRDRVALSQTYSQQEIDSCVLPVYQGPNQIDIGGNMKQRVPSRLLSLLADRIFMKERLENPFPSNFVTCVEGNKLPRGNPGPSSRNLSEDECNDPNRSSRFWWDHNSDHDCRGFKRRNGDERIDPEALSKFEVVKSKGTEQQWLQENDYDDNDITSKLEKEGVSNLGCKDYNSFTIDLFDCEKVKPADKAIDTAASTSEYDYEFDLEAWAEKKLFSAPPLNSAADGRIAEEQGTTNVSVHDQNINSPQITKLSCESSQTNIIKPKCVNPESLEPAAKK